MEEIEQYEDYGEGECYPEAEEYNIYKKGQPLYMLNQREYSPSMNLLKTFSTNYPDYCQFFKDNAQNKWSPEFIEAFISVMQDVINNTETEKFNTCQQAALFEIFYSCFQYFAMLPALVKDRFLEYFRETLLLYTVNDLPVSMRIFNYTQAIGIAKLFQKLVSNNFEMMKYVLMPVYRIEIEST